MKSSKNNNNYRLPQAEADYGTDLLAEGAEWYLTDKPIVRKNKGYEVLSFHEARCGRVREKADKESEKGLTLLQFRSSDNPSRSKMPDTELCIDERWGENVRAWCTCRDFAENCYACKHIAALAIHHLMENGEKLENTSVERKMQENTGIAHPLEPGCLRRTSSNLSELLKKQQSAGTDLKKPSWMTGEKKTASVKLNLELYGSVYQEQMSLEMKGGPRKCFVIKNLDEFFDAYRNSKPYPFSGTNVYPAGPDAFSPENRKILDYLASIRQGQKRKDTRERESSYYYGYNSRTAAQEAKSMLLTEQNLDGFMELMNGKKFFFTDAQGKNLCCTVDLVSEPAPIHMEKTQFGATMRMEPETIIACGFTRMYLRQKEKILALPATAWDARKILRNAFLTEKELYVQDRDIPAILSYLEQCMSTGKEEEEETQKPLTNTDAAELPVSVTPEFPASVMPELRASAASEHTVPAASELPVSVTPEHSASVTPELPASAASELPAPAAPELPAPVTPEHSIPAASELPVPVTSELPVPVTPELPVPVTPELPASVTPELPVPDYARTTEQKKKKKSTALELVGFSLADYEKEIPQIRIYLDYPQENMITCKIKAYYPTQGMTYDLFDQKTDTEKRNLEAEQPNGEAVWAYFDAWDEATGELAADCNDDRLFRFLTETIPSLSRYGDVMISDRLKRLKVKSSVDINVGIQVDAGSLLMSLHSNQISKEEIIEVLSSYNRKRQFTRLKNGTFITNNQDDSAIWEALAETFRAYGKKNPEAMKIPMFRALYMEEMLQNRNDIQLEAGADYLELLRKLKNEETWNYAIPGSLENTLRAYQKDGYRWLCMLKENGFGGILADDMGLGKTLQILAFLLGEKERRAASGASAGPTLIIAPASLVYNWQKEIRTFTPQLTSCVLAGSIKERKEILERLKQKQSDQKAGANSKNTGKPAGKRRKAKSKGKVLAESIPPKSGENALNPAGESAENPTSMMVMGTAENPTSMMVMESAENPTSMMVMESAENPTSMMVMGTAENPETSPVSASAGNTIAASGTDIDIYITSYDLLKRDIEHYEGIHFDNQIIDEAQYIKNQNTQSSKAVRLIDSSFRMAITGTPIENRLSELWSIFDYIMPGFLYGYTRFREDYESPVINDHDQDVMDRLRRMVHPFILRRLKKEVLKDLPDKLEEPVAVVLEGEQRKVYDAYAERLRLYLDKQSDKEYHQNKLQILAELTTLRQICCGPELILSNFKGKNAKMEACIELLHQAIDSGHKVLLFSQFVKVLDELGKKLKQEKIDYYRIDGSTSKEERMRLVDAFQNENDPTPVFCISLKAGGTGLNLTAADIVIHYDPWWNLAAQNQATDRTHRIGQTNTVTVYSLIAEDTIEEQITTLQRTKAQLAEDILSGEGIASIMIHKEDLMALL